MLISHVANPINFKRSSGRSAVYLPAPGCLAPNVGRSPCSSRPHSCTVIPSASANDNVPTIQTISDLITSSSNQALSADQVSVMEQLASALSVPVSTIRNMAFKRKGLLALSAAEVTAKVELVAKVVEVPVEKARQMCVIQPGLLTDTERNAEVLANGLRLICYDLKAPKEEVVELITNNPSILHGRELRLSVADMANLALMREPRGRIAE